MRPLVEAPRKKGGLPKSAYGGTGIAIGAIYLALHLVRSEPVFPLDDPYITLHSAQVMHWGADPNYLGVSPLYGATSLPYLLLVYILVFLLPPIYALDAACWLGVFAYAMGLIRMVRVSKLSLSESLSLIALGLTTSFIPLHLLNGLETSWALAGVIWSLTLASEGDHQRKWAALIAGAVASLRPELGLFTLLLLALMTKKEHSGKARGMLLCLGALPIIACALWYLHATGSPYPQTALAKRYFYAQDHLPWKRKLQVETVHLVCFFVSCGFLMLALPRMVRSRTNWIVPAFAGALVVMAYVQCPGSLAWNDYRYLMPMIPMLVWGLRSLLNEAELRVRTQSVRLLHVSSAFSALFLSFCLVTYQQECAYFDGSLRSLAAWSTRNLPSNAVLLVHDAGYIAFATRFRTVDMVGLKTPEAIALNRQLTWSSAGSERAIAVAQLASRTHATHLIALRSWPQIAAVPSQLRSLGWSVEPLRRDGEYQVFKLTAPGGVGTLTETPEHRVKPAS